MRAVPHRQPPALTGLVAARASDTRATPGQPSERLLHGPAAQVMVELDDKKRVALEATWRKVNDDFGSIFSTLLPGTTAKLEPQQGCSFLEGAHRREQRWRCSCHSLGGGGCARAGDAPP